MDRGSTPLISTNDQLVIQDEKTRDERGKSSEIFNATNNYAEFKKQGNNFENFMMQNVERMKKSRMTLFDDNEFSLSDGEEEVKYKKIYFN